MLLIFAILLIIILVVLVRCIVIVPQSNAYVTEWLGVYKDTWGAGLHIRTPGGAAHRLDDEEMIAYYAGLAHSLGGRVRACYVSGFAVKTPQAVYLYEESIGELAEQAFWLTDTPCAERRPGWPLDSLSLYKDGKPSFLAPNPPEWLKGGDRNLNRCIAFLKESLGLQPRSE